MSKENRTIFCQGKVKFYDAHKNQFGFIEVQSSENQTIKDEVYFKEPALRDSSAIPRDGVSIYCYAQKGKKGYFAKEVIGTNRLTQSERLEYLDYLHKEDLTQLINDIFEGNLLRSDSEITFIVNAAMDHYQSLDPVIWKFLYKYGDDNQSALLSSYISELNLKQKLSIGTSVEGLLEQIVSDYSDYSPYEILEVVNYLVEQKQLEYISNELWIAYLKTQLSVDDTILATLKSDFKTELTLEHFPWTARDILNLIKNYKAADIVIDQSFLLALLQKHYSNFSFSKTSSSYSYGNQAPTYLDFLNSVLNQNLNSSFIIEFAQISANFIYNEPIDKVFELVLKVKEVLKEAQTKNLSAFYSRLLNQLESNFSERISDFEDSIIIEHFESIKVLNLYDEVVQRLSRPSLIKLHYQDDSIEIDFIEDYKYLDQLDFDVQRKFIYDLSITAKNNSGKLFWSVINKMKETVLEPNNKSYDPSTVFILYLLSQLEHADTLDKNTLNSSDVFEFVYSKLTDESLIKHKLNGYFENCQGRAFAKEYSTDKYTIKRTKNEPCQYCEGKLMINTKTGNPAIDTRTNKEKYWCRNNICLAPSRQDHENHTHYFSNILENIGFTNIDYFVGFVNGWVNKINSYLDHLQCRKCNKALIPKDIGSGYYRVSHFYCNNSECKVSGEDNSVYITHCINSKCEELIDSRDSAQCSHNWYICTHCLGCCSTEKIQKRIEYYSHINRQYNGPTHGHKDEGKLYCPDCGKLITSKNNIGIYDEMLNKFIRFKTQHPNVIKWGQRNTDNKYWFLLKKLPNSKYDDFDNNITKLSKLGFSVAEDYEHGNEIALISESYSSSNIICKNCEFSININELYQEGDFYRAKAVEKWHNKIFN